MDGQSATSPFLGGSERYFHVKCAMNTFQHVIVMWDVKWIHFNTFNAVFFPCEMCNENISTQYYFHVQCAIKTFPHVIFIWDVQCIHFNTLLPRERRDEYISTWWIHFNMMNIDFNIMNTFQHHEYTFQHKEYISTRWIHFNMMNIFQHDIISMWDMQRIRRVIRLYLSFTGLFCKRDL